MDVEVIYWDKLLFFKQSQHNTDNKKFDRDQKKELEINLTYEHKQNS